MVKENCLIPHTYTIAHVEVRFVLQIKNQICLCNPNDPFICEDELEEPCIKKAPTLLSSSSPSKVLALQKGVMNCCTDL